MLTDTADVLSAISRASPTAAPISSPCGWTERTSPRSLASAASNTRPVMHHSSAVCIPTSRGRNQLLAASGVMPRRANTKPKRALSLHRRMSKGSCIVAPTPTATPLQAPMSGFLELNSRKTSRPPPSRTRSSERFSTGLGSEKTCPPPSGVRSAPAQNARSPCPVTMTARTLSSASVTSSASINSCIITRVKAFIFSGRWSVTVAMPSAMSSLICVKSVIWISLPRSRQDGTLGTRSGGKIHPPWAWREAGRVEEG